MVAYSILLLSYYKKIHIIFVFNYPTGPCRPNEWTCDNGDCIDEDRVCDFREDCRDGSDEEQNCKHNIGLMFVLMLTSVENCDILCNLKLN